MTTDDSASTSTPGGTPRGVEDRGAPTSYLALQQGTPVYGRDGVKVGTVEHVLAAADEDIFDGLVIDTRAGSGGWRFADASQIEGLYERAVVLGLDAAQVQTLPAPEENPAAMKVDPDTAGHPGGLEDKLRRAWDLISGRY